MNKNADKVIKKYNVIGDDIFYHHTFTERNGKNYYHAPTAHKQHEVLFLLRGEVTYTIESETYLVREGEMIFVAPHEIHSLQINGNDPYERIVLLFDMNVLEDLFNRLNVNLGSFSYVGRNRFHVIGRREVKEYGLDHLLLDIISCKDDDKYKRLFIISKLIRFVIGIDKLISKNKDNFAKPDREDKLISSAAKYIDEHISKRISLEELADVLFVSKSSICHRFSSVMSMSVAKYIALKKMNYATGLLRSGYSAAKVANILGYENYTSFFYNYKKIMGHSPSDELRRNLNQRSDKRRKNEPNE